MQLLIWWKPPTQKRNFSDKSETWLSEPNHHKRSLTVFFIETRRKSFQLILCEQQSMDSFYENEDEVFCERVINELDKVLKNSQTAV